MARRGKTDEKRGGPKSGNTKHEGDGHHAYSADQHGRFAGSVHGKLPPDEAGREPSARNASEVGDDIDDQNGEPDLRQAQTMLTLQIVGNPKQVEPPDGVDHKFSSGKRPCLSIRDELRPLDFSWW